MKVSLIVPAYNEKENIPELLKRAQKFIETHSLKDWEMIVVDDGSTDGTGELLDKLSSQYDFVKVVHHRKNLGVTHALFTGYEVSKGDILVFYPADLQFSLEDVYRMIEVMEKENVDIVTGKKVGKYEKKTVSKIYNALSRWLFKVPATDINSIKAMKREVIRDVPLRKDWHRYIVPIAYYYGYSVKEIPVKLYPRLYGKSKYRGISRIFIGMVDLIAVKFHLTFMRKPLLFFGGLGFLSILLGIFVGIVAIYFRFVLHKGYRPLLFLISVLVLTGFMLFTIGFLGEMIAAQTDNLEKFLRERKEERNE